MALNGIMGRDESTDKLKRGGEWKDVDGNRRWVQFTKVTLSGDDRCLGLRSGRSYYSNRNQCSAKASKKWSDGNTCKKCSDELQETLVMVKTQFWDNAANDDVDNIEELWHKTRVIPYAASRLPSLGQPHHLRHAQHKDYENLPTFAKTWVRSSGRGYSITVWNLWEEYMEPKYIAEGRLNPDYLEMFVLNSKRRKDANKESNFLAPIRQIGGTYINWSAHAQEAQRLVEEKDTVIPEDTRITSADAARRKYILQRYADAYDVLLKIKQDANEMTADIADRKFSWEQTKPSLFGEEE